MTLPNVLSEHVKLTLRQAGDTTPVQAARRMGGGDINDAALVQTERGSYFVKWHSAPPPRFFECEADGLSRLTESGTVRTPQIVGHGTVDEDHSAFIVLEWIERAVGNSTQVAETLGRQLAMMHREKQSFYGLDHDNFIGSLPQPNRKSDSWVEFYRTQRLGAQKELALQSGRLPASRARLLDALMDRLPTWINEAECHPSLLHGDLWGGNWMQAADGQPVLIDPAVYYGDREADIAMTALFGGFPQRFYDAYHEIFPLQSGYQERQPLYQLYYLLCHLNLFGESYGGQVDAVLRRYV